MKNILLFLFFIFYTHFLFASTPLSVHKDWTLFKTKVGKKDMCYIASLPVEKEGDYKKRGEPYIIVTRAKNANYDEINVSSGFLYNEDKDVFVSILKRKFPLFPNDEKAWTYDKNDDVEIIKQMMNGAKMYVLGYSKNGAKANDTYSLLGFNDAYREMLNLCK